MASLDAQDLRAALATFAERNAAAQRAGQTAPAATPVGHSHIATILIVIVMLGALSVGVYFAVKHYSGPKKDENA